MSWKSIRRAAIGAMIIGMGVQAGCDNSSPASSATTASNQAGSPGQNPPAGVPANLSQNNPGLKPAPKPSQHDHDHDHAGHSHSKPTGQLDLPAVRVEPSSINLGTVRPGVRMTGSATIVNTGNTPIRIVQSKADCACTSVDLANTVIEPNQSIPLYAHFIGSALGNKTAGVRILFENHEDYLEVPVHANVAMAVRAEPSYINALPTEDGTPRDSGEFTVSSEDGRPFNILAVNGGPVPFIDFNPASDSPRDSYRLRWDFTVFDQVTCKDSAGNHMPGWIVVETDHPEAAVFDLEVRHECVRRPPLVQNQTWVTTDKRALVGLLHEGDQAEFEMVAKFLPNRPKTDLIKSATSQSPRLSVELLNVQPISDGMLLKLRVKALPGPKGMLYESIKVRSDRHEGELLVIGTVR